MAIVDSGDTGTCVTESGAPEASPPRAAKLLQNGKFPGDGGCDNSCDNTSRCHAARLVVTLLIT